MRAIRGEWSGDDRRMRGENQAGQKSIRKNAEIVTERDIYMMWRIVVRYDSGRAWCQRLSGALAGSVRGSLCVVAKRVQGVAIQGRCLAFFF